MENVYQQNGFNNRKEYLQSLAEDYDVDVEMVYAAASMLGANEDFDGLVSTIQDYSEGY